MKLLQKNFKTHTPKFYGKKEFNEYVHRLKHVRLKWCKHIFNILDELNIKINTINDIGCNYFQLYKEIKLRKVKYDYFGYDICKDYIDLGLSKYPELNNKYKLLNAENTKPRKADCTIASGVLEHCDKPSKMLENILITTKKIIIIRTNMDHTRNNFVLKKGKKEMNYRVFSFKKISKIFQKKGFLPIFILDKASKDSKVRKLIAKNEYRTMYILVGLKK